MFYGCYCSLEPTFSYSVFLLSLSIKLFERNICIKISFAFNFLIPNNIKIYKETSSDDSNLE